MHRPPCSEVLDMDWVARLLDMTEHQLRGMLHRDNKDAETWFPEMLQRLRELEYPEMVVFEQEEHMHYTIAVPLNYDVEILFKKSNVSWQSKNGRGLG
tara:strand:+ start:75 stop:368 length:294 start_codon:yes stop_codon:yes gene_type:complete